MTGGTQQTMLIHLSKFLSKIDTSGRYVVGFDMSHWIGRLSSAFSTLRKTELHEQMAEGRKLGATIAANLKELGYGG
jgi:hypothetical protein